MSGRCDPLVPENNNIKSSCHNHLVTTCRACHLTAHRAHFPKLFTTFFSCPKNYGLAKSPSRQPWYEPMPRDRWKLSAAHENVITVPAPYIFINTAQIGIRGNAPSLMGMLKCSVLSSMWCTAGNLNSLCVQNQPISGI